MVGEKGPEIMLTFPAAHRSRHESQDRIVCGRNFRQRGRSAARPRPASANCMFMRTASAILITLSRKPRWQRFREK